MSAISTSRLIFLDYMRVFAFVSVLCGHKFAADIEGAISNTELHITIRYLFEAILPLCAGGAAGVVVFFLTSGYIITHVLQKETTLDFVVKRFFRIYPLYVFAVTVETFMAWYFQATPVPPLAVMLPRLLLIGDFFDVPNSLAGVEWTLRIEILFYSAMAIFKITGLFRNQRSLPFVYLALSTFLYLIPAFPGVGRWNAGYVNTYTVFLFIGSLIYLSHHKRTSNTICATVASILGLMFLIKISAIQPFWKESNYAIIATGLFLIAHHYGPTLRDGRVLRVASDLTFSVYLFHNWLWGYLETPVSNMGLSGLTSKLFIATLLFLICYVFHITIEKLGLFTGQLVINKLPRRRSFVN